MHVIKNLIMWLLIVLVMGGRQSQNAQDEKSLWIYTSLYKDTIADLTPRLKKAFPEVKFNWFQAGSALNLIRGRRVPGHEDVRLHPACRCVGRHGARRIAGRRHRQFHPAQLMSLRDGRGQPACLEGASRIDALVLD